MSAGTVIPAIPKPASAGAVTVIRTCPVRQLPAGRQKPPPPTLESAATGQPDSTGQAARLPPKNGATAGERQRCHAD
jgi:hypothetical protein